MSLLPQAGQGTLMLSTLTSMYKWGSVVHYSISVLSLEDAGFSSQLVSLRARQTRARHDKHLTSVSAWEQLALRASEPPDCLTIGLHTMMCVLVFHIQTQDIDTEANYWTTTTLSISSEFNRLCFDLLCVCWCWYVRNTHSPKKMHKISFSAMHSVHTLSLPPLFMSVRIPKCKSFT